MAGNHSDEKESGEGMEANDFNRKGLDEGNHPCNRHYPKKDGVKKGD
jgi:hypothetical protein